MNSATHVTLEPDRAHHFDRTLQNGLHPEAAETVLAKLLILALYRFRDELHVANISVKSEESLACPLPTRS